MHMSPTKRWRDAVARASSCLLVALIACVTESDRDPAVSVTDSAGITIIANPSREWGTATRWAVDDEPDWTIGADERDEVNTCDRITDAVILNDGGVAVADMGSSQARLYDADGKLQRALGRAGPGPGEFRQITGISRVADGVLAVHDRLELLHIFRHDGAFIRTVRTGGAQVAMDPVTAQLTPVTAPLVAGWLNESTFVTAELTPIQLPPSPGLNEAQRPEIVVKRRHLNDSEGVELLRIAGPAYYPHPMNLILPAVFGAEVNVSTDSSRLVRSVST